MHTIKNDGADDDDKDNLKKCEIESKQKDLEIEQLKQKIKELKEKNEKLHKIESQYNIIMKCIDTKNGFLLQNAIPIIPDIDYFSSKESTEKNSVEMMVDKTINEMNESSDTESMSLING